MEYSSEIQSLIDKAFNMIEIERFQKAIGIGNRLTKLGYSIGSDIVSQAYKADGNNVKAIEILEKSVKEMPDASALWLRLGICYTDEGRFSDAYNTYEIAASLANADAEIIKFETIITKTREKKFEEALMMCEKFIGSGIKDIVLYMSAATMMMFLCIHEEEYTKTIEIGVPFKDFLCKRIEDKVQTKEDESIETDHLAEVSMWIARAYWDGYQEKEIAVKNIKDSLIKPPSIESLKLLRTIDNIKTDKTNVLSVMVQGINKCKSDSEFEPMGFFSTFHVFADDEHEAMGFIDRILKDETFEIKLAKSSFLESISGEEKGIHSYFGRTFFMTNEKPSFLKRVFPKFYDRYHRIID
jgi:hypothetical protein